MVTSVDALPSAGCLPSGPVKISVLTGKKFSKGALPWKGIRGWAGGRRDTRTGRQAHTTWWSSRVTCWKTGPIPVPHPKQSSPPAPPPPSPAPSPLHPYSTHLTPPHPLQNQFQTFLLLSWYPVRLQSSNCHEAGKLRVSLAPPSPLSLSRPRPGLSNSLL